MLFYFFFLINAICFWNYFSKYYYKIREFCKSIFDSNVIQSIKTDSSNSFCLPFFLLIIMIIFVMVLYIFLHYKVTKNQIIYDHQIYKNQIKSDVFKITVYVSIIGIILYSISKDIEIVILIILLSILMFIFHLLFRLTDLIYISKFFMGFPIVNNYDKFVFQLSDDQKSKIILNYNEIYKYDKYAYEMNKNSADSKNIIEKIFGFINKNFKDLILLIISLITFFSEFYNSELFSSITSILLTLIIIAILSIFVRIYYTNIYKPFVVSKNIRNTISFLLMWYDMYKNGAIPFDK